MGTQYTQQTNFTGGELAPGLLGRDDQAKFQNGGKHQENWFTLAQGGLTKRGGLRCVVKTKENSNDIKGLPFTFSSDPSQSYSLEFGYDSGVYIRIHHLPTLATDYVVQILSSGARATWNGATYDFGIVTDAPPWVEADILNIWEAQQGDVLYIAAGYLSAAGIWTKKAVHKLTRSGTTQPGTWDLEAVNFIGSAYRPPNERKITIYAMRWSIYNQWNSSASRSPANSAEFTKAFQEGFTDSNGQTSVSVYRDDISSEDTDWGVALGIVAGASDRYNNQANTLDKWFYTDSTLQRALTQSGSSGQFYGIKATGTLWIPANDKYYFGVNGSSESDLIVNGESIASKFGNTNPRTFNQLQEFFSNGSITLTRGAKSVIARTLIRYDQPSDADWGLVVAWRRNGDAEYGPAGVYGGVNGSAQNELAVVNLNDITTWNGNQLFEIEIEATSATVFKWRYCEVMTVSPETYRVDALYPNSNRWSDYTTGVSFSAAAINLSIAGSSVPSWVDGEVHPGATTFIFGKVSWPDYNATTANMTIGDKWRFKCGFLPIPAGQFRSGESEDTSDDYPLQIDFFKERSVLSGYDTPNLMRLSAIRDPENFTLGAEADQAMELQASSGKADAIIATVSLKSLIAMTPATVYKLSSEGKNLTPADRDIDSSQEIGASHIKPVITKNMAVFADRTRRRLFGIKWNEFDVMDFPELSIWSYHLLTGQIRQMAWQQTAIVDWSETPVSILWMVMDDGTCAAMTLEEKHQVHAMYRMSSGAATFESVWVTPGDGQDIANFIVKRNGIRTIEYLDPDLLVDGYYLLTKNGSTDDYWQWSASTHYVSLTSYRFKSTTVQIYSGSTWIGEKLLDANGLGTLATAVDEPTTLNIGTIPTATWKPLAPSIVGREGSGKAMKKRRPKVTLEILKASGIKIDGVTLDSNSSETDPALVSYVGFGWSDNPTYTITHDTAATATILSKIEKVNANAY